MSRIKFVSVMPCYDKKLEAVRPDFSLIGAEDQPCKEVDTVLATHELVDLFAEKGINLSDIMPYDVLSEEKRAEDTSEGGDHEMT